LTSPYPRLIAIAAMASNRVIGRDGKLPWHLPEDLKFFKKTTLHHAVLMGRKTFESIVAVLGKPLPQRQNIVLSRTMTPHEGVRIIASIDELQKDAAALGDPVYLIGGAQLYESLLDRCAEIYLTQLDHACDGDSFFPAFEDRFCLAGVLGAGEGFEIRRYVRKPQ
jgi:dihydrofolate reductase